MDDYEVHDVALMFPIMGDEELDQLANDIQTNGLLEPVVLYEGKVLDGRNRLRACAMVGVEPTFRTIEPDEDFVPLVFVVSKNLHRRHLTPAQRAAIALDLLPHLREMAQRRQKLGVSPESGEGPEDLSGKAARHAASMVGIGKTSVETANAISKRDPEVIEAMRDGKINIEQAARAVGLKGHGEHIIESGERDALGRNLPRIAFGKGDKWKEAIAPIIRYLTAWEKREYEFRHVNPKEARRRLQIIEELQTKLSAVQKDLEQRAHSATLTVKGNK